MHRLQTESPENANGRAFFDSLDAHSAAKLVQLGIEVRFEPGATVFRPRDESGPFFYIISGSIALETPGAWRAIRVETLHAGDFLGWSALLRSGTRHFQA